MGRKRDGVFLVFEYCEHDMAHLIDHMGKRFSESEVKNLVLQLLKGVEHLHEHWIIHRDIKMSNLLYTNTGRLKLADFGLARLYGAPPKPMTPKVFICMYGVTVGLLACLLHQLHPPWSEWTDRLTDQSTHPYPYTHMQTRW